MKKLIVLSLVLCLVATSAQALPWQTPILISDGAQNNGSSQIAVENGQIAIAHNMPSAAGTWPQVFYNELTYSGAGALTQTVVDEALPGSIAGTWGTYVQGIGIDDGQPVIATAAWTGGNTNARVNTRTAPTVYTSVDATANMLVGTQAAREAFQLDSSDNAYYVYTDTTGASGNDVVVAKAPVSTTATGSWTQSILSSPGAGGITASPKAKIAVDDTTGAVQTAFMADRDLTYPPEWSSADGTTTTYTTMSNGTATSTCDIALQANGYPMVSALDTGTAPSGVKVAFYDGVTPYTVSTVLTTADSREVGWYNTADAVDLELDGQGRPVVIISRVDNPTTITQITLDYYVYESGVWTGENVLTAASTTWLQSADLTFDENGRPFIAFCAKLGTATNNDLYLITIPEPATMIMLLGGALGLVIRRKK